MKLSSSQRNSRSDPNDLHLPELRAQAPLLSGRDSHLSHALRLPEGASPLSMQALPLSEGQKSPLALRIPLVQAELAEMTLELQPKQCRPGEQGEETMAIEVVPAVLGQPIPH